MSTEAASSASAMRPRSAYEDTLDCVHCGLCLPACPTYDVLGLETDSPRGRLYLMRAAAEGKLDDPRSIRVHLDQCLACRACETACPSGVRYGAILERVRAEMQEAAPRRGLGAKLRRLLLERVLAHPPRLRAAFTLLRLLHVLRLDRLAARGGLLPAGAALLLPEVPPARARRPLRGTFPAEGPERGRVALFTGCVMEQLFGNVNRATLRLLTANGFTVDVVPEQVCCGALLLHEGNAARARELAQRNVRAFDGQQTIVVNSAGCGAAMKEYGELLGSEEARAVAARTRDVCELLAERGLRARPAPRPLRVAYDDPCHLCHGQGVRRQPRELLRAVPGLQLVEHRDPESCCGSAGIYNLLQPQLATRIGAAKAEALARADVDVVATGNPGCILQIRAHLRRRHAAVRVAHPVELLLPE